MKKHIIYKYSIGLADLVEVKMPEGAYILTAQMQGETLCLWAVVDDEQAEKFLADNHSFGSGSTRLIEIIGTGNPFFEANRRYIATVQSGPWVWHVFERLQPE